MAKIFFCRPRSEDFRGFPRIFEDAASIRRFPRIFEDLRRPSKINRKSSDRGEILESPRKSPHRSCILEALENHRLCNSYQPSLIGRVYLQPVCLKFEHPQNCWPAFIPFLAVYFIIIDPHSLQRGAPFSSSCF